MAMLLDSGVVLGVDTGTKVTGWAVLTIHDELVESGTIELDAKEDLESRLFVLRNELNWMLLNVVGKFGMARFLAAGIETPYVGKNMQSALKLGKAWGVVAGKVMNWGVVPYTIYPTTAKKALSGVSRTTKYGMIEAAHLRYGVFERDQRGEVVGSSDEADAIGVALATVIRWKREHLANQD